ncbi:MAG: hypothetical protein EBR09_09595 [Proteobacteria bacterium]|nr:hypothetical protein [Pseudomonadota bacterium]
MQTRSAKTRKSLIHKIYLDVPARWEIFGGNVHYSAESQPVWPDFGQKNSNSLEKHNCLTKICSKSGFLSIGTAFAKRDFSSNRRTGQTISKRSL